MEENELNQIIDRKIAESKLQIAEQRMAFVLKLGAAILSVFGIFIPLWLTNRATDKADSAIAEMKKEQAEVLRSLTQAQNISSDKATQLANTIENKLDSYKDYQEKKAVNTQERVDKAIADMQSQFKDLAGTQLRKPYLECLFNNSPIEGAIVSISDAHPSLNFVVKNTGDAPARNIRVRLYSNLSNDIMVMGEENIGWSEVTGSDEPLYNKVLESYRTSYPGGESQSSISIDPKEIKVFKLVFPIAEIAEKSYPCLLKIYYEQPEPRRWSFVLTVDKGKQTN